MMLSNIFIFFLVSRASVERIVEVLDETSDLQNGPDPVYEVQDGSIVFEDVTFAYSAESEKPVLCDINLSIPSGARVGILGGTGSSKSTLIQLIPRLYDVVKAASSSAVSMCAITICVPARPSFHRFAEESIVYGVDQGQSPMG